jgi:hypothetical protein
MNPFNEVLARPERPAETMTPSARAGDSLSGQPGEGRPEGVACGSRGSARSRFGSKSAAKGEPRSVGRKSVHGRVSPLTRLDGRSILSSEMWRRVHSGVLSLLLAAVWSGTPAAEAWLAGPSGTCCKACCCERGAGRAQRPCHDPAGTVAKVCCGHSPVTSALIIPPFLLPASPAPGCQEYAAGRPLLISPTPRPGFDRIFSPPPKALTS